MFSTALTVILKLTLINFVRSLQVFLISNFNSCFLTVDIEFNLVKGKKHALKSSSVLNFKDLANVVQLLSIPSSVTLPPRWYKLYGPFESENGLVF